MLAFLAGICVTSLKVAFFAVIVVAKCFDNDDFIKLFDTCKCPISTVKLIIYCNRSLKREPFPIANI